MALGGVLQVTPMQGSPRHWPALQPLAQVISCIAYVQPPMEHAPGET
jgi:hypothetical protein